MEKIPPQRQKLPPKKGALFLTWQSPLNILYLFGALISPNSKVNHLIRLTLNEVEHRSSNAANSETISEIFENPTWTRLPIILDSTRHILLHVLKFNLSLLVA
jgi:hypothetical protein